MEGDAAGADGGGGGGGERSSFVIGLIENRAKEVLKGAKSVLLHNIYQIVCENPKYANMRKRIGDVIDENVVHSRAPFVACTQECFAVKAGIDGLLDVAR